MLRCFTTTLPGRLAYSEMDGPNQSPSVFRNAYCVSRAGPGCWRLCLLQLDSGNPGPSNFKCAFSQNDILISSDESHRLHQSAVH